MSLPFLAAVGLSGEKLTPECTPASRQGKKLDPWARPQNCRGNGSDLSKAGKPRHKFPGQTDSNTFYRARPPVNQGLSSHSLSQA